MFLQTGGGGKGIRPNQQHQQQQHHHQSHHQSNHQTHHPHAQQQQPPSIHHGHPGPQQTHSHHPHQQTQQQQSSQQQQTQQQPQHHHPPPQLSYYPYQLGQAPPPPPAQHPQAPNNAVQGAQMAPSPPTQVSSAGGSTATVSVAQSHGMVGGGGGNVGGNSSSATNIARQHAAAAAAAAAVAGGNANIQHYSTGTALMQPPTSTAFMTTTYLQQYHQQSAAVIAAAAAAAQYNNSAVAAAAAANNHSGPGNSQTSALYQQQQQQHHQALHHPQTSLHAHYYHPSAGATPTPPPHMHPHHHPQQHQLRGVITAPPHQRQPQATYLLPANAIFALPSGPLTAAPRTSLLTAGTHQQGGTTGAAMPVAPLLQSSARAGTGGPTAYITPPFCQPPLPMGAAGLTPPQPLLATAASMTAPTLQTYGHLTGTAASSSSSTTSLSAATGSGSGSGSTTENVKQRKYAIPIIHPITHENILDPKPQKKSTAVEAKPSSTDLTSSGVVAEQQGSGAGTVTSSTSQFKDNDKSITVSIAKIPSATTTASAAAAASVTGSSDAPIYASASKEKIDQQMQTDAVRDKNIPTNRVAAPDLHTTDSSPAISTASGGEDGDDYTSGDMKTPRTDLDSDGNDLYVNDEEQITVVVEELAADASTGRVEALEGDDEISNYDDAECTSLVDVVNDEEDEEQTEEYIETKRVQAENSLQQQFVDAMGDNASQRQLEPQMMDRKFESTGTTASLGSSKVETDMECGGLPYKQQQSHQERPTAMTTIQIAQRPRSSSHQNTTTMGSNVTILTSTTSNAGNMPTTLTMISTKTQLKSTRSTTTMTSSAPIGGGSGGGGNSTVPLSGKGSQKFSPTTSGASSSNTSTPTHQQQQQQAQQQHHQQQQQKKSTATTANIMSVVAAAATAAAGSANSKKNRKASKRAKESQKKSKQSENSNRSNSSSSSNNNNMNNNKGTMSASSSLNNNLAVAATTATPTSILTDMNNANSYSGSCSNRGNLRETTSTVNLRQQQQQHHQQQFAGRGNNNSGGNNNNSKNGMFNKEDSKSKHHSNSKLLRYSRNTGSGDSLSDDPTVSLTRTASPAQQRKHTRTQEIVSQFLQPHSSGKMPEEQQLQFLNSSSSACEDDEEVNARLQMQLQQQDVCVSAAAVQDLRFGDFAEEKEGTTELSHFKAIANAKVNTNNKSKCSNVDIVDCSGHSSANSSGGFSMKSGAPGMKFMNKVFSNSASGISMSAGVTAAAATAILSAKPRKYTLEELKALAKTAEARKPPMVLCQKGDCISQLFVSRQQHHHLSHHAHNMSGLAMHPHLQQQQYQHMNFNESMELVTGKRRGGQTKKHHEHQAGAVGGVGGNVGGGVGAGAVGGGGPGGSNAQAQRKMDFIRVQLSLKEEIKLSECENAWQPETLRSKSAGSTSSGSNDDIEAVLKKVRGVLNKLTPDNFDVLLKTMTSISMNTQEKMQQVMLLIFEKTISEPNFAPTYAKFCKVLFQEIKAESKSLFSNSLITRIQHEFETNVNDADAKKIKLQPLVDKLENCTEAKERLELQAELEDKEYQFRRRAWGTVRFIGEMYKLQSLTSDRVLICIESLLEHGCEEKLEYMCKLLTTVGHLLESTALEHNSSSARMDKIFRRIQEIVQKSRGNGNKGNQLKISSRVRFMMQDVMDLRSRCWDQPQSQPQQQQQIQQQQQQRRTALSTKQEEKMQSSGGMNIYEKSSNRLNYGNQNNPRQGRDGGHYFQQKSQKSQFMQQQEQQKLNIDLNKLKFTSDEVSQSTPKLGNSTLYLWRTSGRTASSSNNVSTASGMPTSMLNVNSSQHSSAANSGGFKRQTPTMGLTMTTSTSNPFQALDKQDKCLQPQMHNQGSTAAMDMKISDDDGPAFTTKECQKLLNRLIEEVLDSSNTWQDEAFNEWRNASTKQQVSLLHYLLMDFLHLAVVKRPQRKACAAIFVHLMRTKAFNKQVFAQAYAQLGDEFQDLLVDVPNGWTYVFEFIGPLLHEHLLQFSDIWLPQWAEDSHFTKRFLKAMINYFTSEFGATYMRDLWNKEFKLDCGQEFMSDATQWREFVASNGFQYIYDRNYKPPQTDAAKSQHSTAEQVKRIEFLLNTASGCDLAIDYINTNVHINTNFIRSLTKFLCCDYATVMATSIPTITNSVAGAAVNASASVTATDSNSSLTASKRQLNTERFRHKCMPLLRRCLDGREAHEIACLDVIVDAMQQFFDETTANQLIFSVFDILYDCEVIPKESFDKWYRGQLAAENENANSGVVSNEASAANGASGGGSDKSQSARGDNNAGGATKATSTGATSKKTVLHKSSNREVTRLSDEMHAYMEKLL